MCATCTIDHAKVITSISFRNGHKAPPKSLGRLRLRELRRQPLQKFSQKAPQSPALKAPVNCPHCGQKRPGKASVPTPALYPAFFFVLGKAAKSAGNAVIPTFPTRWSHGLQHLRHKRPTLAFVGESGHTLGPCSKDCTQGHTRRNRGRFGWGWYHYPRSVPHVSRTSLRGRGIRTASFAAFGAWSWVLPKNAESLRDSDALMRVAVP